MIKRISVSGGPNVSDMEVYDLDTGERITNIVEMNVRCFPGSTATALIKVMVDVPSIDIEADIGHGHRTEQVLKGM